jgi:hypothetical protein
MDAGGNSQPTHALEFGTSGDGIWTTVAGRKIGLTSTVTMLRADSIVAYYDYSASSPLETKNLALAAPQAWTTVEVANSTPPGRLDHCGAYDFHQGRLVVFGGQILPYSNSDRRWLADTWVLSWFNQPWVGVDPSADSKRPFLGIPSPNPARDRITVELSRPRPGPGSLEILDIHGRRVMERRLDNAFTGGSAVIRFDRPLAPGVYLLRLLGQPRSATRRFCILH